MALEVTFFGSLALDVNAYCICEIHYLALDGVDLNTIHKLSSKEINSPREKISAELGFQPGAAGWEASELPLCYAAPDTLSDLLEFGATQALQVSYWAKIYKQLQAPGTSSY